MRDLIDDQLGSSYAKENELGPDDVVDDILDFVRFWPTYNFPRYLVALDRISRDVLEKHGRAAGDFTMFAAMVENLFLEPPLLALEEYGLPYQAARKLAGTIAFRHDLDGALAQLAELDPDATLVDPFERELMRDVQGSLPASTAE